MTRLRPVPVVRIGFMPLLDAAIPIIAAEMGFAEAQGIRIDLVRENSWANIRDRLAIGHFDAAHLLAPLPVAAAMGLTPFEAPLITPLALGLGGNAITVSGALWQAMQERSPGFRPNDPVATGSALRLAIAERHRAGAPPLVFAVVHSFSSHNYELCYWLAASGIDPDHDIRIAIVPPPFMPDALAAGRIDGFCVGEPWNSRAARVSGGHILLTKAAIWRRSPEKMLALNARWAEEDEPRMLALLTSMLEAAQWCDDPANRAQLAAILGRPDRLDVAVADILPALEGRITFGDGQVYAVPDMLIFARQQANLPWPGHALWYLSQMIRWGQAMPDRASTARMLGAIRPDLCRKAMRSLGWPVPPDSMLPVAPGDVFFDAVPFDPEAFLASLTDGLPRI